MARVTVEQAVQEGLTENLFSPYVTEGSDACKVEGDQGVYFDIKFDIKCLFTCLFFAES